MAADQVSWAAYMLAFNARPPDPSVVGSDTLWRHKWHDRLENTPVYLEEWLRHQRRDAYWEHGSVCEDFAAIQCPVMAVSGWADGYKDAVFRILDGLKVEVRAIIGPWAHEYPEVASPGPAIGFLQEALRWWDQWLLGRDSGILREPALRAYIQESVPPRPDYQHRPGRWVGVSDMALDSLRPRASGQAHPGHVFESNVGPGRGYTAMELALDERRLQAAGTVGEENLRPFLPIGECADGPGVGSLAVPAHVHMGMHGGVWCNFGMDGDYPVEQAPEDDLSLCFDSPEIFGAPLDELLGFPRAALWLQSGTFLLFLVFRLWPRHGRPEGSVVQR